MTIRYDNLHVTVERGHAASTEMISWLTSRNINTVILTYTPEDIDRCFVSTFNVVCG